MTGDPTLVLDDGRTLAWAEYGDPSGAPVLFFHGLPGSRLFGRVVAADAETAGVRLVVPDRPGFGRSTFQEGRTFADWPADVRALVDRLGLARFAVAGISGGGVYTLAVARDLGDRVTRAGVISGGGDISTPEALEGMSEGNRAIFELSRQGPDGAVPMLQPVLDLLLADPEAATQGMEAQLPPADVEILRRRTDLSPAMTADGLEAMREGVRGTAYESWLFTRPWPFDVAEITVPVTFWHGADDRNAPLSHAQALAARIPQAELVVWPDMGHLTAIDRMAEILGSLVR